MTTLFAFDFTQASHTQAFAQMCTLATQAGVPMQVLGAGVSGAPTQVQAQASTPTPVAPKVYAPAQDVECKWVQDGMYVSYTLADGKYAGQTGVRKTLNARMRNAGAEYMADKKAYKFASKKSAEKFVAETSALVSAQEIEDVRAKAQARADKKAQKGA